jgi:hypothetical protein
VSGTAVSGSDVDDTVTPGTAVAGAAGRHGARDPLTWVVAAAVSLPLVVAAVVALRSDWVASSDWGLLELRIRDVGGSDTPLTGPYSRYDWYHPGPALFWLLAPVYRLAGSDAGAMYAAAAVLNIVAVIGACVVARRLGGRPLLVVTGVVLAIAVAGGASDYADPWNPYLIVLPLVLFLLAAAATAAGDPWAVPVAVAAGAFVVQAHVGNAVVVAVVGIAAVVSLAAVRRWSAPVGGRLPASKRWAVAGVTAAVVVAMWSAPLAQQVTGDPGNLGEILAYFTSAPVEPAAGLSELPTVLGLELGPLAPWVGVDEPVDRASQLDDVAVWWALPLLVGMAAAVVMGWRRHHRGVLALSGTAIVATAAGALATTRITGITYPYLLRFWWAIAMVGWMAVLWAGWSAQPARWVARRRALSGRVLVGAAVAVVAVPAFIAVARIAPGPPDEPNRVAAGALAPDVLAGIEPGAAYAVVPNGQSWGEHLAAVVNLLDANGHPVATHPYFVTEYGEHLTFGGPGAPSVFAGRLIVATNEGIAEYAGRPGLRVLAEWDPLSPDERREMTTLRDVAVGQFTAAGRPDLADAARRGALGRTVDLGGGLLPAGVDAVVVDRIATLEERGIPVVVFLDPTAVGTDDLL